MKVVVTQSHIVNGIKTHPMKCPIALACADAGVKNPSVGAIYLSEISGSVRFTTLPKQVQDFILKFDIGLFVEPFEFEIEWSE